MSSYYWKLKVKGYNPRQPRVPKGSPQGGQWTSIPGQWMRVTSKENTLAKGDDTELYRWSNLGEIVEATFPRGQRRASFDVSDQPWWYFAPPGLVPSTGKSWVDNVYGRVVLDREKLAKAGWAKAPGFEAEGAWFWKPGNLGGTWRDYPDKFVIDAYLDAIQGYEITDLPEGRSVEDVRAIVNFRLGRDVPIIGTDVRHVTEPFDDQRRFS